MIIGLLKNIWNRLRNIISNRSYKKAIKKYDKAICLEPDNPCLYSYRGNAHESMGEYAQALENYTRAIELDPDHVFYNHFNNERASLFIKMGDPVSALLDYSLLFTIELPFSEIPCIELFDNSHHLIKEIGASDLMIDPTVYDQILANINKVLDPQFKPFEWTESMLKTRLHRLHESLYKLNARSSGGK